MYTLNSAIYRNIHCFEYKLVLRSRMMFDSRRVCISIIVTNGNENNTNIIGSCIQFLYESDRHLSH